ncbi:MAG: BTAD domain-containing putative transcriptional regulator [Streptosporangiaceae bacterium]
MDERARLRLLGPVQVWEDGAWRTPVRPQLRLLLAVHALSAGQVVLASELVDLLWDDRPPASARASLHALVTRLRQALSGVPECGLDRHGDGYRLRIDRGLVDVHQFRSLARAAREASDGTEAMALFDRALALWRGPALADVAASTRAEAIRRGLGEEYLAAVQDRFGCLLAAGRDAEAAVEIPIMAARHPLSERLAGLQMLAWYRCGRQADALQVFRDLRARLSGELGVEPGPELQRLHQQILSADSTLTGPGAAALPLGERNGVTGPGAPLAVGAEAAAGLEFGLLGPLLARRGDQEIAVPAGQRALLAALLLRANHVVPASELADVLWDGAKPTAAEAAIHDQVTQLWQVLGDADHTLIRRLPGGYVIRIGTDRLDVTRFEALRRSALDAARRGNWAQASARLGSALALWRGRPLEDVPDAPLALRDAPRLAEMRLQATEDRAQADLHRGLQHDVAAELTQLVAAHPLRERMLGLLMLALYRDGRRAAATAVYEQARRVSSGQPGSTLAAALRPLFDEIQAGHPALRELPSDGARPPEGTGVAVLPRQLPPAPASFTGRQRELQLLTGWLDGGTSAGVPVILVVTGTAGVGKTALALQWAHQLRHRFPDGQLYLNLRGFCPSPAPAGQAEAITTLLESLDVPPGRIPRQLAAQVGLYRSLLAGRRMLIVLDNARDEAQVRPLLPGSASCAVVVTSRSQFVGLAAAEGARLVALGMLTADEAGQLLAARLGPGRAAAEPESVTELADLCGRLPLALAITAAQAATRPALPLSSLAAGLRDARARFDALDAGDETADIRSAFSWSYRLLGGPAAALFRLLGAHPGPDISLAAAASLVGGEVPAARAALSELARASLVLENATGRFAVHDLLRAYAAELCDEHERRVAIRRAADHYLRVAHPAMRLAYPAEDDRPQAVAVRLSTPPEPLADRVHALAWLEAEHRVLLAMTAAAAEAGLDGHAAELPAVLCLHFARRGYFPDWAESQRTALAAATRLADEAAQARAHRALGDALVQLDSVEEARAQLRRALTLYRRLGDEFGQAVCHGSMSRLFDSLGDPAAALSHGRRALRLYQACGHLAGQARALNGMGWDSALLGRITRGFSYCQQALELNRQVGDRFGEASTLDSIGYCWHLAGRPEQAIIHYEQALEAFADTSDRYSLAHTLDRLADARRAIGSHEDAHKAWRQAIAIFDAMHHPDARILRAKLHDAAAVPT